MADVTGFSVPISSSSSYSLSSSSFSRFFVLSSSVERRIADNWTTAFEIRKPAPMTISGLTVGCLFTVCDRLRSAATKRPPLLENKEGDTI